MAAPANMNVRAGRYFQISDSERMALPRFAALSGESVTNANTPSAKRISGDTKKAMARFLNLFNCHAPYGVDFVCF